MIAEKIKTEYTYWNCCVIIMDNTQVHFKDDLKKVLEFVGIDYKFLLKYSSGLTHVEECFSTWKRKTLTIFSTEKATELLNLNTIVCERSAQIIGNSLIESIRKVFDVVTVDKCAN